MIGDLFAGNERANAMGTYQMMLAVGPAIGPLLGGWIGEWADIRLSLRFWP